MLLDLLLIFCIGFVQSDEFTVDVVDRFTVRVDGADRLYTPDVKAIAVSPDGSEITVASNHGMMFIRPSDGEIIATNKEKPFTLVYSADGSRIYSISSTSGSKLIRVPDKSELPTALNRPKGYVGLKLEKKGGKILISQVDADSPAAAHENLAIGSEIVGFADGLGGEISSVVGQETKEVYKKLEGASGSEFRLAFIPRGKIEEQEITLKRRMIDSTASGLKFADFVPKESSDTTLWCMAKGFHEIRSSVDGSFISSFSFDRFSTRTGSPHVSPSGKLFAWVAKYRDPDNAKSVLGDALTRKRNKKKSKDDVVGLKSDSLGYSRGDKSFYGVEIRNVFSKKLVATFPVGKDPKFNGGRLFRGVHIDSDDQTLVVTTHSCLHVYSIETGKRLRVVRFVPVSTALTLNCSAISGRLGAAGDTKGIVRIVDLVTGETLQTLKGREKGDVTHMAFSKDGSVLSYHVDGVIHAVNLVQK